MISLQDKVLADICSVIESVGLQPVSKYVAANMGGISLQLPTEICEYGEVRYNFQRDSMEFNITIGGKAIPSQPDRSDYFVFFMTHTQNDQYKKFRKILEREVKALAAKIVKIPKK